MKDTAQQLLLAIDPAIRTGWAWTDGNQLHFGVWDFSVSGSEHAGKRLLRLEEQIWKIENELGIDRIAFEDATHFTSRQSALIAGAKWCGAIERTAAELDVPFSAFRPHEVKQMAGLGGNAKKPEMIQAARVKLGIDVSDPDAADACWLLELAKQGVSAKEKQKAAAKVRKKVRERTLF